MIKILILEDEIPARSKLKRFIDDLNQEIQLLAEIDTVEAGISFLKSNKVDLIFADVELLDGQVFEIFNQVSVTCPIIFTTAYDQFWLDAFETNGIAYLLKPFSPDRFQKAWNKFLLFRDSTQISADLLSKLTTIVHEKTAEKAYKTRFSVRRNHHVYFLPIENITFFESVDGLISAHDIFGKKHILTESSLNEIEELVNPVDFFRINRPYLVNKWHIEKMERFEKNTLAIQVKACPNFITTSSTNTAAFKKWIEQ